MTRKSFNLAKALQSFRLISGILMTKILLVNIRNQVLSVCSLCSYLQETFEIQKIAIFV